jgi:hypothetical protein
MRKIQEFYFHKLRLQVFVEIKNGNVSTEQIIGSLVTREQNCSQQCVFGFQSPPPAKFWICSLYHSL